MVRDPIMLARKPAGTEAQEMLVVQELARKTDGRAESV